jgi:hypothetical protein
MASSCGVEINGSGFLSMQGIICGEEVDVESNDVRAWATIEIRDQDIDVETDYKEGVIGFQIEYPELLEANKTFAVSELGFLLEGEIIAKNCGLGGDEEEILPSSGDVTIAIYDGQHLEGTFDVVLNGESISGAFDIDFQQSLEPYFK